MEHLAKVGQFTIVPCGFTLAEFLHGKDGTRDSDDNSDQGKQGGEDDGCAPDWLGCGGWWDEKCRGGEVAGCRDKICFGARVGRGHDDNRRSG
jgi:hypothetical protein